MPGRKYDRYCFCPLTYVSAFGFVGFIWFIFISIFEGSIEPIKGSLRIFQMSCAFCSNCGAQEITEGQGPHLSPRECHYWPETTLSRSLEKFPERSCGSAVSQRMSASVLVVTVHCSNHQSMVQLAVKASPCAAAGSGGTTSQMM